MKKVLSLLLLPVLCSAAELRVPALWKAPASRAADVIQEVGFSADAAQAVWAVRFRGLEEMLKTKDFLISLYMDTDSSLATGRTPGKDGCDFQMNIQVGPRTLSAIDWRQGRYQRIPFSRKDYLVDHKGDILYIVLRGGAMKDAAKWNDKMTLRMLVSTAKMPRQIFDQRINLKSSSAVMLPALEFTGFSGAAPAGKSGK